MYENVQFIHFFLAITSLLDTSIKLCRNSDTIGAMAGSIAEAYYSVPIELEEKALSYLPEDLQGLCHAFRTIKKPCIQK